MTTLMWACAILLGASVGFWFLLDRYFASQRVPNVGYEHPHNMAITGKREMLSLAGICLIITFTSLTLLAEAFSRMFGFSVVI